MPDLVAMLRSMADPRKATAYDRVRVAGATPEGIPAPVQADVIDAQVDLLHTISAGQLRPGAESDEAYEHALRAVGGILAAYEEIANDRDLFMQWWDLVMPAKSEVHPEFWTVTRVMHRWPLEDRRRWANQPCPECGLKTIQIDPPRHRHALTWFSCSSCPWRKSENDDDGLWASALGLHVDQPKKEGADMRTPILHPELDLGPAMRAGTEFAHGKIDSASEVSFSAFMVGATPELAEAFAEIAEKVAAVARASYENGALLANGARLVATAIRDAAADVRVPRDEKVDHG